MRIGVKLLVAQLLLVGLVAAVTGLLLPRWVQNWVIEAEQARLEKQAIGLADRLSRQIRARQGSDSPAVRGTMAFVEELLVDESMAIVDPQGYIVRSTLLDLRGKQVPLVNQPWPNPRWIPSRDSSLTVIKDVGPVLMAIAPLRADSPSLRGYSVAMIRDLNFIQSLSRPITQRLSFVLLVGLIASAVIAFLVSQEMVKRLQATGAAARALAEGDLTKRAPARGNDEIAELAGHFNHMAGRIEALIDGLKRSEKARQGLLVTVSHELRTPMTSISGFAEALRDGVVKDQPRRQRYYEIIASEAARLTRLTNDLFDVAKLEAGQVDLNLQSMSITPWLVDLAERFKPEALDQGIELDLQLQSEVEGAKIYGDRDRLDQVMNNLLGNALRYAPEGTTVSIGAVIDGDELHLSVTDKGPGMSEAEAEKAFERFFQGSNHGRGHKGAGLGLAIVRSLVEAHGGTVTLVTAVGRGASFLIRLKGLYRV
jgi:signal transduction histidine kinase